MFTMKLTRPFWDILDLLNWRQAGDDEKVINPVIEYLRKQSDDVIFQFDEQMAEHLYAIDGKMWANSYRKANGGVFSDDGFLYCRCVAIVNGQNYFNSVFAGRTKLDGTMEFEAILSAPRKAWARKHKREVDEYPYITSTSYESGSNEALWKS